MDPLGNSLISNGYEYGYGYGYADGYGYGYGYGYGHRYVQASSQESSTIVFLGFIGFS